MAPISDNVRREGLQSILNNLRKKEDIEYNSLIISIDFGTTYSGIGYVFTSAPDEIHTVTDWPSDRGVISSPKVPTLLKYTNPTNFLWGHSATSTAPGTIEAFKLLLDSTLPKPLYLASSLVQTELRKAKKTAADATKDFIGALYVHALEIIGNKHAEKYLEVLRVKYVVSIPAGWPAKATAEILKAARSVGMDPVIPILEPEAAAYHTLQDNSAKSAGLKVGDAITICDAGGGTVDLISYEIKRLNPPEMRPVAASNNGLAGSLMLNKRFKDHVKQAVGDEEYFNLNKSPAFRAAIKQFDEDIKPDFVTGNTKNYSVRFPGANLDDEPTMGLKNDCLTLSPDDMKTLFQPLVTDVNALIDAQKLGVQLQRREKNSNDTSSVKAIFLVGGFGANKHLLEFLTKLQPGVKLIQPTNAWTAVIRGALLHNLPVNRPTLGIAAGGPISRLKATHHYGIACSTLWDESQHPTKGRYWDSFEGVWRTTTITWCIDKGTDLSKDKRIAFPFSKRCPERPTSDDEMYIKADLKQSNAATAPLMAANGSVSNKVTLTVRLETLPPELFQKKKRSSDKEAYWEIQYELVVEVKNRQVSFFVEVNGKEYGKVDVSMYSSFYNFSR